MKYSVLTDVGRMRSKNQDAAFATDHKIGTLPNLFVIADGMGGHNAGEYASSLAIDVLKTQVATGEGMQPIQIIDQGITTANRAIYEEAAQDVTKAGMGTTVVVATLQEGHLSVANVGDSRLYLLGQDGLRQITRDHSVVEEMVRKGEVPKEAARNHPKRNLITRAVGAEQEVKTDFFDEQLHAGDVILMCTDGLTTMVKEEEITQILASETDIDEKAASLVERANANGGRDNITVIVIEPFSDEVKEC